MIFCLQTIIVGLCLVPWISLGVTVLIGSSFSYPVWPWEGTEIGFGAPVRGLIPMNVPKCRASHCEGYMVGAANVC